MRKFWIDCLLATILVFVAMWAVVQITRLNVFNAFDSIGQALEDIDLTDYVFKELREEPKVDDRIVLVNIGNLDRRGIAEQIQIISKYNPRLIGLDIFFDCKTGLRDTINCPQLKDTFGNLMLSNAIREAGNVVLVTKVLQADTLLPEDKFDSLRRSDPDFREFALAEGFANLDTEAAYQDDVKTCREFHPVLDVNSNPHYAFGVQLAMLYDSTAASKIFDRGNETEVVNYRGNVVDFLGTTNYPQLFFTIDVDDVMTENFDPALFKDKIVIMGYLGAYLGDPSWSDKFYTPLNKKLAGKANPDMFGAVVHANILAMILNQDYVEEMEEWQEIPMAIILCFLNVALFAWIHTNLPDWYDGITKLLQLLQLILYSLIMVEIFYLFSYKLNITLTLGAVALVGDVYEIYVGVVKNVYRKIRDKLTFTPKEETVLTPINPEEP